MQITFQGLIFEIPVEGLIQLVNFSFLAELNQHGQISLKILMEESKVLEAVHQLRPDAELMVWEGEMILFRGRILSVKLVREKALNYLTLVAISYTYDWSLKEVSQSFCDGDSTYENVAKQVLMDYSKAVVMDCATEGALIPEFLLQYEESDWTFLKRLASHFHTYLVPDFVMDYGRVYFGIPKLDYHVEIEVEDYIVKKDMEKYYKFSNGEGFREQEAIHWKVERPESMVLGENVLFNQIPAVVTRVSYFIRGGELIRSYEISRRAGMVCAYERNPAIFGMSIRAMVKERVGNEIRVHFDVDQEYMLKPKTKFFTYAIETSGIYCMPEIGSLVHVYFPSHYEQDAIAVHAIRTEVIEPKESTVERGGYAQNPDYKSFSNVNGAELVMMPELIGLSAERERLTTVGLYDDGVIEITGKNIDLRGKNIRLSARSTGREGSSGEKSILLVGGEKVSITIGDDASQGITLTSQVEIMSPMVKMVTTSTSDLSESVEVIREEVTKGDKKLLSGEEEKLKYRLIDKSEKAVKQVKDGATTVGIILGTVALYVYVAPIAPAATTGVGAKTYLFAAASGVGVGFSASDIAEGLSDYKKSLQGDLSPSLNFIRDVYFGGNESWYEFAKSVNEMVRGITSAQLIAANMGAKFGKTVEICGKTMQMQTVSHVTMNVATGLIKDYAKEGTFNPASVVFNMGLGMIQGSIGSHLGRSLGKSMGSEMTSELMARLANIGATTVVDVGLDATLSYLYEQDFNLGESLIKNAIANALAESTGEPVDAVSGAYRNCAVDMMYADVSVPLELKREYLSTVKTVGSMGNGWSFLFDSRIYKADRNVHLESITGHRILFEKVDEGWICQSKGCGRFRLYEDLEQCFRLEDRKEHRVCHYDKYGCLSQIVDQNGQAVKLRYANQVLVSITTSLGNELAVVCEDEKIVKISDEIGRVFQYRYEEDLLVEVIHADGGRMQYGYNEDGYLDQVTNQGQTYLVNEYDAWGKIIRQELPNGEFYEMGYDTVNRKNTSYYSGLDRREVFYYNSEYLPTKVGYGDGSCTLYEYNNQNYRVKETDRRGNGKEWNYNEFGLVVWEILADGYEKSFEYDGNQNLVKEWDNGGREVSFIYDEHHNCIEECRSIGEGKKQVITHTYDRSGRKTSTSNGRGEKTFYEYDQNSSAPSMVKNPLRGKTYFGYDSIGRKTAIETAYGKVEFGVNERNFVTWHRDGEGNVSEYHYNVGGTLASYYPPKAQSPEESYRYRYDCFGRKTETIVPLDGHYHLSRNGEGDVIKAGHPEGLTQESEKAIGISYDYDGDHNCIRKHDPDGGVERFFYDSESNLVKHVMPEYYNSDEDNGVGYTYVYDVRNRLVEIYNPDGELEKSFVYDYFGNVLEERDALGYHVIVQYNHLGNMVEKRESIGRKGNGITYRVMLYRYDLQGNKVEESYGKEEVFLEEYPKTYQRLAFKYDENDHLILITDDYGASVRYGYDCLGNVTYEERIIGKDISKCVYYTYNKAGWLVQKKESISGNGKNSEQWAVTTYAYDVNGNVTQIKTPNGYSIYKKHDARDRVMTERTVDKENGIDRTIAYRYDHANHVLSLEESGAGVESSKVVYSYDFKDLLTKKINPLGGVHRYLYDRNDRLRKEIQPKGYEAGSGNGIETGYHYDNRGNLEFVTNGLGQVTQKNRYNRKNQVVSQVDAVGNQLDIGYTTAGQLQSVSTDRSREEQKLLQEYQYNARGQIIGIIDGNQNQTNYQVDNWGRITKVISVDGSEEAYSYNFAGAVTKAVDANGNEVSYRYNSFGKVSEIVDQVGESEYFYYDKEENLVLQIDRNGNWVERCYNVDGNLVRQTAKDNRGEQAVEATYRYNSRGQLSQAVTGGFSYQYRYAPDGQLLEKSTCGKTLLKYEYNTSGKMTVLQDVTGKSSCYSYDILGRLENVKDDSGVVVATYRYRADNKLETVEHPNGISTCYLYDSDGNISRLVTKSEKEVFIDFVYKYDGNGNRLEKQGVMPSVVDGRQQSVATTFIYDGKNQLIEEAYQGNSIRYGYDPVGNRLGKATTDDTEHYLYNCKNQLLEHDKKDGKTFFTYDAQGSILKEAGTNGVTQFEYNPLNQQIKVMMLNQEIQVNRYDAEGLRAEMQENKRLVKFLFHKGEILVEMDQEDQPVSRFMRGHGVEACEHGERTCFYYKDEQLSTSMITNEKREIENLYCYDAFGVLKGSKEGISNRIGYTGQQYDGASGQYYLRARYYNPVLGRFMQEDVYRGDGLNLYAYCGNNPVVYCDPSGYAKAGCPDPSKLGDGERISGADEETYYFRGTTEDYEGSPGLQRVGVTPASTDPLVSTVFAIESEQYGEGVVYIASTTNLKGVDILEGNVLNALEREVCIDIKPTKFYEKSSIVISAQNSREILNDMGYSLPNKIYQKGQITEILTNTPKLSTFEINTYLEKIKTKK